MPMLVSEPTKLLDEVLSSALGVSPEELLFPAADDAPGLSPWLSNAFMRTTRDCLFESCKHRPERLFRKGLAAVSDARVRC